MKSLFATRLTNLSRYKVLSLPSRNAAVTAWNKDWKPAPNAPTNEAEIAAAAKKYGLIPQDYKADPECGDYPDVPLVGTNARDPYEQWDDRYWRRNWGEPVHKDFNMYVGERMDTNRDQYTILYKVTCLSSFLGILCFLYYLDVMYGPTPKLIKQQMPKPGVVHYTFERADE